MINDNKKTRETQYLITLIKKLVKLLNNHLEYSFPVHVLIILFSSKKIVKKQSGAAYIFLLIVRIYEIFLIAFRTPDQSDQISLGPYENIISEKVNFYFFMMEIAFSGEKISMHCSFCFPY